MKYASLILLLSIINCCSGGGSRCFDTCNIGEPEKYTCEPISEDRCIVKVTNKKTGETEIIDYSNIGEGVDAPAPEPAEH